MMFHSNDFKLTHKAASVKHEIRKIFDSEPCIAAKSAAEDETLS